MRMPMKALPIFLIAGLIIVAFGGLVGARGIENGYCASTADCTDVVCLQPSSLFGTGDGTSSGYSCDVNSNRPCTGFCGTQSHTCLCGYSVSGRCDQAPSFDSNGNLLSLGDASSVGYSTGISCYLNGVAGTVYQTLCPGCGNGLTYCKPSPASSYSGGYSGSGYSGSGTSGGSSGSITYSSSTLYSYSYCGNGICEYGENQWNCPWDCSTPYYAYCSLDAFPRHVNVGGSSEVAVKYFDLFYEPLSAFVDCGNGRGSWAWGCYGTTGVCYALCQYDSPGAYVASGFAGGVGCYPVTIYADAGGATPTPSPTVTPSPTASPSPTVYPPSCRVSVNPSTIQGSGSSTVIVSYLNTQVRPTQATVVCGNGNTSIANCAGDSASGSCITTCGYSAPSSYPAFYVVDGLVNGLQCTPTWLTLVEGIAASPTPTASPTPNPALGALQVTVLDDAVGTPIQGATVSVSGIGVFYSDANGIVFLSNLVPANYTIQVSKEDCVPQTVVANVVANQTTFVTVRLACGGALTPSCSVSLNPSTIVGGGSTLVTVNYLQAASVPSTALVSCGNGQSITASCTGTAVQGVCTGTCGYGLEQNYPQFYTVTSWVNGVQCSTGTAKIIPPAATTGKLLVQATDCADGAQLQGALVTITPLAPPTPTPAYTDSNGQVLFNDLTPGLYTITVFENGFVQGSVSASVVAGQTVVATICLNKATVCPNPDFTAEVVRSPDCPYSNPPQPYQLRITNNLDVNNTINLVYSSGDATGPAFVTLSPRASTIVNVDSTPRPGWAGGNYVMIALTGNDSACTKNIQLPVCLSGGLSVEAVETSKTGFGGETVCFDLLARNNGLASGLVQLSAAFNASEAFSTEFTPSAFMITSQEIKNVNFCVKIPEGATTSPSFVITATSPINDASSGVVLNVLKSSQFSTSFSGCQSIDATTTVTNYALSLTNNAVSGDYEIAFTDNDLQATLSDAHLYNFELGTSRSLNIRLNAFGKSVGQYNFDLLVKKDDNVVYQIPLCFNVGGTTTVWAQLIPTNLNIQSGQGKSAQLRLKNLGTVPAIYSIVADTSFDDVTITPSRVSLNPGEETIVDVHVSPTSATARGSYTIPIRVYAGATGTYFTSPYSVSFDCGNGRTQTATCGTGSGSCTASCYYPTSGTYTPSASIAGYTCTSSVRVLDNIPANSVALSASSSNIVKGSSVTVTASLNSLKMPTGITATADATGTIATITWATSDSTDSRVDYGTSTSFGSTASNAALVNSHSIQLTGLTASTTYYFQVTSCNGGSVCATDGIFQFQTTPSNTAGYAVEPSVRVSCGNGDSVDASNCVGTSGSCTASCYYSSSGTYTITATVANAFAPTIYSTAVVASDSGYAGCALSAAPNNVVSGGYSTISMNYYNIAGTYGYGTTTVNGALLESENLLVNVVSSTPGQYTPIVSSGFQLLVEPVEVVQGITARVPIVLKNDNYFGLSAVLLYASGLPSGITMTPISPFSLDPGEEKTVYVYFQTTYAPAGNYNITLHAESPVAAAPDKYFSFTVNPRTEGELAVGVGDPDVVVQRIEGKDVIVATVRVWSNEQGATQLRTLFELPANWTYEVTPITTALQPGESKNITAKIYPKDFDPNKEYTATMVLVTPDNRGKKTVFSIYKPGVSPIIGMFTGLSTDVGLVILIIAAVLAGAALVYLSNQRLQQAKEGKEGGEPEAKESKKNESTEGKKEKQAGKR